MKRMKRFLNRAFTLIELLAVVAIVCVLFTLSLPAFKLMRRQSDKTATANSLRSIGIGIQQYLNDNDGMLPGPLLTGQTATYATTDQGRLGYYLWSYLGSPAPKSTAQVCAIINNPANLRYRKDTSSPVYLLNNKLYPSSGGGTYIVPWGYGSNLKPYKQVSLTDWTLSQTWALQDADQLHPSALGAGWISQLPPKPPLGDIRMTLYFDWHVDAVAAP